MKKVLLYGALMVFSFLNAQSPSDSLHQEAETRKTVELFFKYLDEKNPEKIASCIAENVDWYIFESEQFPWTGRRTKREEIPEVFRTLFSYFVAGKDSIELESFLVDGNEAVVFAKLGRQFKSTNKSFTMLVALHFTV